MVCNRLAAAFGLVACAASAVWADSITFDGKSYTDVLVTESDSMYYVLFPATGKSQSIDKTKVDASKVVIDNDPEKRRALRLEYQSHQTVKPEPAPPPGPQVIRERLASPSTPMASPKPAYAKPPVSSPMPTAVRPMVKTTQAKVNMLNTNTNQPIQSQANSVVPPVASPTPVAKLGLTVPTPVALPSTSRMVGAIPAAPLSVAAPAQPQPLPASVEPTGNPGPNTEVPTITPAGGGLVPVPVEPEQPVVIEHQTFTDNKGVKTLIVHGNRERDPDRPTRIAERIRSEEQALEESQAQQAQAEEAAQIAQEQMLAQSYNNAGRSTPNRPMQPNMANPNVPNPAGGPPQQQIVVRGSDYYVAQQDPYTGQWYIPSAGNSGFSLQR